MKLSPQSEEIVKATAGVVAEHAEQITSVFYPDMFAAHPELMRVFNKANQAIGEQPKALAASVDGRRLRPGEPGDLVLLDADPLAPAAPDEAAHILRHMPVLLTICAGVVTHAAAG